MPIAAVPDYLGKDFSHASPGLRFGMYLPLWGINRRSGDYLWETHDLKYERRGQERDERKIKDENKDSALRQAVALTPNDLACMQALQVRQQSAFATLGKDDSRLCLPAISTAPFTTGLGNEHPLENGFAFLNPYGLPYLPGSGVKGVLRQAARELASGEWGDAKGWSDRRTLSITVANKELQLSPIDALFGYEADAGETTHVRGALSFWDVIPQIQGKALAVEVMTPHQGHYYQQKPELKSGNSATPHDSGQPIPINFLTVPPGSGFVFHVVCDRAHLARLALELARDGRWKTLLQAAFEHAFAWLGFGAKTAVGYGALAIDAEAVARAERAEATRVEAARRASLSPAQQTIDDFVAACRTKHEQFPAFKDNPNGKFHGMAQALAKAAQETTDWTADEKRAAAEAIETWLPKLVGNIDLKDQRKKLKLAQLRGQA